MHKRHLLQRKHVILYHCFSFIPRLFYIESYASQSRFNWIHINLEKQNPLKSVFIIYIEKKKFNI
jgi:hypothetical protein